MDTLYSCAPRCVVSSPWRGRWGFVYCTGKLTTFILVLYRQCRGHQGMTGYWEKHYWWKWLPFKVQQLIYICILTIQNPVFFPYRAYCIVHVSYDSQYELFPLHSISWLVCVVEMHCEIGIEFSNNNLVNFSHHRSQDFMKLSLLLEVVNS
jgi:hypothetical protein